MFPNGFKPFKSHILYEIYKALKLCNSFLFFNTYKMNTTKTDFITNFLEFFEKNFDTSEFDISLSEASGYANDFLDNALYGVEKIDLNGFDIDNARGLIPEYADGLVDIYYTDIYASAEKFSKWTDEAQDQGFCEDCTLDKLIQAGQYLYYSALFENIVSTLDNYIDTLNE